MKVLIAPWGDPSQWQGVRYGYKGRDIKAKDPLKLIQEVERVDKTIIIALDTLADNVRIHKENLKDYSSVVLEVENFIRNFINENSIKVDKTFIAPGTGTFKNKTKFLGNPSDLYYYILYNLVNYIISVIPESLEKLEIILDITHGINFQTFMTQKALFEIAQILAYFVDVKFRTLNSDPYSKEVEELNVNEIEEINVRPHIVIYRYENERKILSPSNLCESENEKEKIGRDLKCLNEFLNDEFYCFSSSFIFGLPLWVIYFLPKVDDMKEFLQKCFEKYVENIVVYKRNDTVEIRRKIELRPTIANVIKIYLVLLMLNKIGISQKIEILLEDIKILKQKIYEKAFPVESNRIDREISEISENREKMDDNYRVFSEIKGIKGKEKRSTIDKRNFFAHAGFEYNSFETKLQNGKIFLKPNDSLIENIKGHLKGALPKGG